MGKDSWGNDKCKKYKNECSNDTSLTCSTVSDCNIKCGDKKSGKKYCEVTGEKKYIKFINSAKNPYFQDATTTANVAPINELSYTDILPLLMSLVFQLKNRRLRPPHLPAEMVK